MLTGTELATAITAVLVGAVALGWVLHWLWTRLSRDETSARARLTEMIDRLHDADRARRVAEDAREQAESRLATREAEMEDRLTAMQDHLDGAVAAREAELVNALRAAEADADAAMSGLGNARRRISELEAEVEALRRGHG